MVRLFRGKFFPGGCPRSHGYGPGTGGAGATHVMNRISDDVDGFRREVSPEEGRSPPDGDPAQPVAVFMVAPVGPGKEIAGETRPPQFDMRPSFQIAGQETQPGMGATGECGKDGLGARKRGESGAGIDEPFEFPDKGAEEGRQERSIGLRMTVPGQQGPDDVRVCAAGTLDLPDVERLAQDPAEGFLISQYGMSARREQRTVNIKEEEPVRPGQRFPARGPLRSPGQAVRTG